MNHDFIPVKNELSKILEEFKKNPKLMGFYPKSAGWDNIVLNVENLEDVAANHFFDDYPALFNLEKIEGHKVREYFQSAPDNMSSCYVVDLHKEFSEYLSHERPEFIERVNSIRSKYNLSPINEDEIYK